MPDWEKGDQGEKIAIASAIKRNASSAKYIVILWGDAAKSTGASRATLFGVCHRSILQVSKLRKSVATTIATMRTGAFYTVNAKAYIQESAAGAREARRSSGNNVRQKTIINEKHYHGISLFLYMHLSIYLSFYLSLNKSIYL